MINNEDLPCELKILELMTKVFDLNLKQRERGYYSKAKELRALDHKLNELAEELRISLPTKYKFDPKDYPEYEQ